MASQAIAEILFLEPFGEIGQRGEAKAEGFHRRRGYGGQEML